MIDRCPPPEDLLDAALGRPSAAAVHVESCDACSRRVREIRALSGAMHSLPAAPSSECLTDEAIAYLADGSDVNADGPEMLHASQCARCRMRITAVAQLMEDPSVTSELRSLEDGTRKVRRRPQAYVAFAGLAAAAAAAIVLLGPAQDRLNRDTDPANAEQHREAETFATAQNIVLPATTVGPGDSLRWTRVPQADLYRVRVWDAEGTVVWTAETSSTALIVPAELKPGIEYMWDVSARTGWDRWVSSELAALTILSR